MHTLLCQHLGDNHMTDEQLDKVMRDMMIASERTLNKRRRQWAYARIKKLFTWSN